MTTPERGRKAGSSFQIDVQIDQVATLPHGRLTTGLAPDLDWDEGEQTWPRVPGFACSDFTVNTSVRS
jgi:hypothetical protein